MLKKSTTSHKICFFGDTVDGQNPAPVDMANIPLFTGFHPGAGFLPSTVPLAIVFGLYHCCLLLIVLVGKGWFRQIPIIIFLGGAAKL